MIRDYKEAFLHYLPWYDKRNITIVDLAQALEISFKFLEEELGVIERNLFIDTALEALGIFQRDLGLKIDGDLDVDKKREIIQGYLHYLHQQTTEKVVKELVESNLADRSKVELIKNEQTDVFDIFIKVGTSLKYRIADIRFILDRTLPSHLFYNIYFVFQENLIIQDKTDTYTNPFYSVGQHRCGTVFRHQYIGKKLINNLNLRNAGAGRKQRQFNVGEIRSGGVKR